MPENVYIKTEDNKFKPIGKLYDKNYLPDGIWYVHHTPHSVGTTNIDRYLSGVYKIGNIDPCNLPEICGIEDYINYIQDSEEYRHLINDSFSWNDFMRNIVSLILSKNKEYLNDRNL